MAEPTVPTKAELLDQLRATGEDAVRQLRATPQAAFAQGRYENGWNGREILAHLASIEWTYARLIDLAKGEPARPVVSSREETQRKPSDEAAAVPRPQGTPRINNYNERQVEKRADASIEDLIDEFAQNRQRTIAAVEGADESLLGAPIESTGGVTGTLGDVLRAVAIAHIVQHVSDLTGTAWAGRRF
jgi:hypothetical protein